MGLTQTIQNDLSIRLVAASEELGLDSINLRGGSTDLAETDMSLGDWLVTVRLPIAISWQAELESGRLTEKEFSKINIDLYRNLMKNTEKPEKDFDDVSLRSLDRNIKLP